MELGRTFFNIGLLYRTLNVYIDKHGVYVVVEDETIGVPNKQFSSRRFNLTKNYNTIESNIIRGMKFYMASQDGINHMVQIYQELKTDKTIEKIAICPYCGSVLLSLDGEPVDAEYFCLTHKWFFNKSRVQFKDVKNVKDC